MTISDYGQQATSARVTAACTPYQVPALPVTVRMEHERAMGGDGYDVMGVAEDAGLHPLSSWGVSGWDLGEWPYVVFYERHTIDDHVLVQYVEGDLTCWVFPDRESFDAAVDAQAMWYWTRNGRGPDGLAMMQGLHRGPCRPELWRI